MDKRLITDKGLVALIDRGDGTYDIGVAASAGELGRGEFFAIYSQIPEEQVHISPRLAWQSATSAGRSASVTEKATEVFHPESGGVYVAQGPD